LQSRERLGKRVEQELRDSNNEIWLSPISTWEVLLLNAKGRIHLHSDLEEWVARATAPFREAPLTHQIASAARRLSISSEDPADRFLAATAQVLGLTLVTADAMLLGLGDIATLANR
jgi:PIN domain nuclease of toxin-antitoxin system